MDTKTDCLTPLCAWGNYQNYLHRNFFILKIKLLQHLLERILLSQNNSNIVHINHTKLHDFLLYLPKWKLEPHGV